MDQDANWYGGRPRPRPHIMSDTQPSPTTTLRPPPKKGAQLPDFGPCLLWPNSWMDQDANRYGGRPRPRRHCVRWGTQVPLRRGTAPTFRPILLWPNGWMDQDASRYEGRPRPRPHCEMATHLPLPKRSTAPNFRPMTIVAKRSPI